MKFLTELFNRFSLKSPAFFQVIQKIAIIAGVLSGLPLIIVQFESELGVQVPELIEKLASKAALISAIVLWVVAKLPIKPTELIIAKQDNKLPFTEAKENAA